MSEVVDAISAFMQSHEVKHEVVQGSSAPSEATDALVFAPVNGWTVVLWPSYFNVHDFPLISPAGVFARLSELR